MRDLRESPPNFPGYKVSASRVVWTEIPVTNSWVFYEAGSDLLGFRYTTIRMKPLFRLYCTDSNVPNMSFQEISDLYMRNGRFQQEVL